MSPLVNISQTYLSKGYGIIEIKDRRLELEKHKVNPICIPKSRNSRSADMENVELKMASLPAEGKLRLSKVKPLPISKSKSGGNTNIFGKIVTNLIQI